MKVSKISFLQPRKSRNGRSDSTLKDTNFKFRKNMYELSESRTMTPKTFAAVLSNMLYERRFGPFFINPVIAGLDPATKAPYITSMDLIGNMTEPEDFAVAGTCEDQLFGKILKLIGYTCFSLPNKCSNRLLEMKKDPD